MSRRKENTLSPHNALFNFKNERRMSCPCSFVARTTCRVISEQTSEEAISSSNSTWIRLRTFNKHLSTLVVQHVCYCFVKLFYIIFSWSLKERLLLQLVSTHHILKYRHTHTVRTQYTVTQWEQHESIPRAVVDTAALWSWMVKHRSFSSLIT